MKKTEDLANKTYQNFRENSKVDIPFNIEEIALGKINTHKKSEKLHRLKIWTSSLAAAAIVTIAFLVIKPYTPTTELYSQNLSDSQKKEQFEQALKIINESLSTPKHKTKTLYNDDKFKIVLGRKH